MWVGVLLLGHARVKLSPAFCFNHPWYPFVREPFWTFSLSSSIAHIRQSTLPPYPIPLTYFTITDAATISSSTLSSSSIQAFHQNSGTWCWSNSYCSCALSTLLNNVLLTCIFPCCSHEKIVVQACHVLNKLTCSSPEWVFDFEGSEIEVHLCETGTKKFKLDSI